MIKDQSFIMNTIDKMQDKLVDDNIISNSEKVLITPVVNNPENINSFNDTVRDQMHNIIDRSKNINPHIKNKIETLLSQYKNNAIQQQHTVNNNHNHNHIKHKLLMVKRL